MKLKRLREKQRNNSRSANIREWNETRPNAISPMRFFELDLIFRELHYFSN